MREDKIAQRGVLQYILTKCYSNGQIEDDETEKKKHESCIGEMEKGHKSLVGGSEGK